MWAGDSRAFEPITRPAFEDYAERHGYELVEAEPAPGLPASWSRVPALLAALADFDYALWLDCDLLLLDTSEDYLGPPPEAYGLMAVSPIGLPSTVIWGLKPDDRSRELLRRTWSRRHELRDHPEREEAAAWQALDRYRHLWDGVDGYRDPADHVGFYRSGRRLRHAGRIVVTRVVDGEVVVGDIEERVAWLMHERAEVARPCP
jgi:hypothetical protein